MFRQKENVERTCRNGEEVVRDEYGGKQCETERE